MRVYAFGEPLAGFIGDRVRQGTHPRRLPVRNAVTVLTGWCSKLWHFVTVRALEGFGETFYFPASMSLASDYHGRNTRSGAWRSTSRQRVCGHHRGGLATPGSPSNTGGAGLLFLWRRALPLALVLYQFLREPRRGQSEEAGPDRPRRRCRGVSSAASWFAPGRAFLMAVFLLANFVATIFLTWTPTFLVEKFHFKLTAAGLSGQRLHRSRERRHAPLRGILADRLAPRLAGGRMLVQALGLLAGSVPVFLVGSTADVKTLLLAMTLFGCCKVSTIRTSSPRFMMSSIPARATAAGVMNTVGWGGGASDRSSSVGSPPTGTASRVENSSAAIASCGAIYLAGSVLLFTAIVVARRMDRSGNSGS